MKKLNTEEEKTSGYKFAAAFLVATGSILYVIYDYIQNNPISGHWYLVTCALIACTFFSILGFLLYIFIDGYLVVVRDHIHAEYLNKIGAFLYKYSLLFFVFFIPCFVLAILIDTYKIIDEFGHGIFYIIMFLLIMIFMIFILFPIFYIILKKDEQKKTKPTTDQSRSFTKRLKPLEDILVPIGGGVAGGVALSILFVIFFATSLFIASWSPFQGHVTIDMESVHYKNDTQIHALIQVTGPNTGLLATVYVYEDLSGNFSKISYIGPIEPIFLDPESDVEKCNIESNDVLIISYLGNGKYSVFINTINLTTGYYELTCLRKGYYEKTCESKSFYILNNS